MVACTGQWHVHSSLVPLLRGPESSPLSRNGPAAAFQVRLLDGVVKGMVIFHILQRCGVGVLPAEARITTGSPRRCLSCGAQPTAHGEEKHPSDTLDAKSVYKDVPSSAAQQVRACAHVHAMQRRRAARRREHFTG